MRRRTEARKRSWAFLWTDGQRKGTWRREPEALLLRPLLFRISGPQRAAGPWMQTGPGSGGGVRSPDGSVKSSGSRFPRPPGFRTVQPVFHIFHHDPQHRIHFHPRIFPDNPQAYPHLFPAFHIQQPHRSSPASGPGPVCSRLRQHF